MGDRLATIDMGQKVGAAVPLSMGGEAGSTSNTMLPGCRPTSVPCGSLIVSSGILIHPTFWPQYINVTVLQTDSQDRQWSRSIGRTVTCNGRPTRQTYMTKNGELNKHHFNQYVYLLWLQSVAEALHIGFDQLQKYYGHKLRLGYLWHNLCLVSTAIF